MITPMDFENKEFAKVLGGYSRSDVDEFFRILLQDYKELYMNNISLKDKVNVLSGSVSKYKSMEDVLQNTLVVAQSTSEDLKKNATEKARAIIDQAENQAGAIIMDAQNSQGKLEMEMNNLKIQIANYKNQIKQVLNAASDMIASLPDHEIQTPPGFVKKEEKTDTQEVETVAQELTKQEEKQDQDTAQ